MLTTGQNRVLIVGGGLGGLALAQGLKRARPPVPFQVFERDASAESRPRYRRGKGLEDDISFGKTFESYRVTSGGVEATFADSTKQTGAILVGADGTRSHIRRQLMPNYTVLDTECGAIYGKTSTNPESRASIAEEFFGGICLAGDNSKPGLKLFTDMMEFPQDLSLNEWNKYRVPGDYVYWVLCINRTLLGIAAEDFHGLNAVQAVETTLEMTKNWHPTVRSLLQSQDPSASSTLAFFASSPETFKREWDGLLRSPDVAAVTLLGDAAHPMTPVGGVGANSAFQEAADLWRTITRDSLGADALKNYAKLMTERGEKTVELSGGGAGHMFQMKPFSELKVASL